MVCVYVGEGGDGRGGGGGGWHRQILKGKLIINSKETKPHLLAGPQNKLPYKQKASPKTACGCPNSDYTKR